MNIRRLDLNLLVLFDALYRLRSVQAASNEVALSPSAFSHGLARLRAGLEDELFFRVGNEMQPSAFADGIAPAVAQALKALDDGLRGTSHFDPATSDRTFVFAATDYTSFVLLPGLMRYFRQAAPNVRIKVVQASRKVPVEELAAGTIDFALGYSEEDKPVAGVREFDWFTDRYVMIARRGHPDIRGSLSMAQYLAAEHVVVTPWGEARGAIDPLLDELGLVRQIAVQVPSVLAAPFIVAETDLIMAVPEHAARRLQRLAPVEIYAPPFEIPPYRLRMYCHAKKVDEPGCRWVRDVLVGEAWRGE